MKRFETFECSGQNLSNSLCQFWNDKSIPLQILHPSSVSWKISPRYFFSSNNIYFAQNEHIKKKIFETFECSSQNSSNSSCQFSNYKSIPLQILHHSSLPWRVTSLWILSSFFFDCGLNYQNSNFETFKCSGENLPYSSCHFPNHKSVLHHPSVS